MGLSGCGGILGGGGGGNTGSFDDVVSWVPDPGLFDPDLRYGFNARSPSRIADVSDETLWDTSLSQSTQFGTLPAEDVEYVIQADASMADTRTFTTYVGDFDAEWTGTKLRQQGLTRAGSYQDYTLYASGSRAFAVDGGTVVSAQHQPADSDDEPEPIRLVEDLIDTNEGDVDSYADANEDMGALADTVSGGHTIQAETFERIEGDAVSPVSGNFENLVGRGRSTTVDGTEAEFTRAFVFLGERDVREREIETYIDESGDFNDLQQRPEFEIDGRTVEITGSGALGSVGGVFST